MRILLPRTFTGCLLGAVAVTGACLGLLQISDYLPVNTLSFFALGVPLFGSIGLLWYFYRMIYDVKDS